MKRFINNLVAITSGCILIHGVNSYLIPFNTEESAMVFSVMAIATMVVGVYGIFHQLIEEK